MFVAFFKVIFTHHGKDKQILSGFSSFPMYFLSLKLSVSAYKENRNECFQFIQSRGKVLFTFETGIISWFKANFFRFFICQKQCEYLMWWNIPFEEDVSSQLLPKSFLHFAITTFFHVAVLHFYWNEKTQKNYNEMKKVERRKGKITIWWVKNMNQ